MVSSNVTAAAANTSPYLEAFGALVKILGTVLVTMAVMLTGFILFLTIWAKRATEDRLYCFFLEQKALFGKLLKIDSGKVAMGKGENKEEYLLDPSKQFWSWWPAGLPKFIQVPIRSHIYSRFNPEPFDPENMGAMISAKSLRLISDEAMLKQTWKDVRESTGVRGSMGSRANSWTLIMVFAVLVVTAFNIYMVMQLQTDITGILELLGVK